MPTFFGLFFLLRFMFSYWRDTNIDVQMKDNGPSAR